MEFPDLPRDILDEVRRVCIDLPEAQESETSTGSTFTIRRRVFCHAFAVEDPAGREISMMVCRADPEERHALLATGHPFFAPRSGIDRIGIVLSNTTAWTEIGELVTESYRLLAPKKLAEQFEPPGAG